MARTLNFWFLWVMPKSDYHINWKISINCRVPSCLPELSLEDDDDAEELSEKALPSSVRAKTTLSKYACKLVTEIGEDCP